MDGTGLQEGVTMTRMNKSATPFRTPRDSDPPHEGRSAVLRAQSCTGNRRAGVSLADNADRAGTDAILRRYRDAVTRENVLASMSRLAATCKANGLSVAANPDQRQ